MKRTRLSGGGRTPSDQGELPQLRFENDGGRYLVTAMPNNGAHKGASGPFTFVDVELRSDTGQKIRVERRGAGRFVDPSVPGAAPLIGLQEFEDTREPEQPIERQGRESRRPSEPSTVRSLTGG